MKLMEEKGQRIALNAVMGGHQMLLERRFLWEACGKDVCVTSLGLVWEPPPPPPPRPFSAKYNERSLGDI